jgi:hypothetical protein|tara:strand:+ start:378 stop:752 length:375 start_codon:yes stop_codon:yes gene_type:complete
MASELRVNTLKDASGNNSVATSFVAGGSAKCWAISNAGAAASDSFNLASTTDNGTGDYTFAISSDMGSANYSHPIGASLADGGAGLGVSIASKAAGSLRIGTIRDDSTKTDCTNISLSILGDLA